MALESGSLDPRGLRTGVMGHRTHYGVVECVRSLHLLVYCLFVLLAAEIAGAGKTVLVYDSHSMKRLITDSP